jgi:hypothetical protein
MYLIVLAQGPVLTRRLALHMATARPHRRPDRPTRPCPGRATGRRRMNAPSATAMAFLHPYRSSKPPPAAAMDHRGRVLGAAGDAGKRLSMSPASDPAEGRSLVHSASAAANGSAARRRCPRRAPEGGAARRGGGSGSRGGAGGDAASAGSRTFGMPGWCSHEKGTAPRGDGDGVEAAEDDVESDDEEVDEEGDGEEKVRWRRWAAGDDAFAGGCGVRVWVVAMGRTRSGACDGYDCRPREFG